MPKVTATLLTTDLDIDVTFIPEATIQELIQEVPLHSERKVSALFANNGMNSLLIPNNVSLYCECEKCERVQRHHIGSENKMMAGLTVYTFVQYVCVTIHGPNIVKLCWNGKAFRKNTESLQPK